MLGDGKGYDGSLKHFAPQDAPKASGGATAPWGALTEGWAANNENAGSFDLAGYWRLALKHRLLIMAVFIAALAIGVVVTLLTTPLYTATATLQIDREAARVLNVDDAAPRESMIQGEEFFQTQYGLLRSRSLAERVIEGQGLDTSDSFLETMGVSVPDTGSSGATGRAAKRRELVLRTVQDNLGVSPVRGSRLVTISFSSPSPQLSAQVANAFAENFIQSNLDRKFDSSSYARQFLEDLISQTKTKLEDSERQLVAYATQQQIISVNDGSNNPGENQSLASNNLVAINGALAQARATRVAAEEKWRQASSAPLMSLPDVFQNPAIQRMVEDRATLQAQYQQNSTRFGAEWPEMVQQKAQIDELDRQINTTARGIRDSIRGQFVVAANQERSLNSQVNALKADVLDLRDRTIQYNILQREVDTSRTLYDGLLQRYKEVGVTGGVTTNNISIVDRADPPSKPSSPKLLINLAIAMLLGIGFGGMAAFVLEALDESLATPDDVEAKLGIPVLGAIPLLAKGETPAAAIANLRSAFSEAYYSLRSALQFSTPDGAPGSILVTSSRPAEGKSTTSFALAQNFARGGKRVLLIDGDLRNPSMHRLVGVDNEKGMSNLLSGSANLDAVVHKTRIDNLSFVSCGPLPPNPAELWGGDRIRTFLDDALTRFDHVIIDGPPILGFADAPILAATVGGTLFVLESKGTRRGQARGAMRRLKMGSARLLGVVLTKFNAKATSYGGYDYSYDYNYGAQSSTPKSRKR
ncbi:GumC family protein [Brevundimonas sp.]|uniref:GumC family protein n=1 Tax=Brevundimonas sp. TaxID=1871086 RepID=UPI003A8FECC7